MYLILIYLWWMGSALAESSPIVPTVGAEVTTEEAVIVETDRPEAMAPLPPTIVVPSGVGAKPLDAPVNELGIELKSMEREPDISVVRRVEGWWLAPRPTDLWRPQVRADLALDPKLKIRSSGQVKRWEVAAEAGVVQDHRRVRYYDNRDNPYGDNNHQVRHYRRRRDSVFTKLEARGRDWDSLADFDQLSEAVQAGPVKTGDKVRAQGTLNGQWRRDQFKISPFAQVRRDRFDSTLNPLFSNRTEGIRGGIAGEWRANSIYIMQGDLARETLSREFSDKAQSGFERDNGKVVARAEWLTNRWIEVRAHTLGELAQDRSDFSRSPNARSDSGKNSKQQSIWDSGLELSSSHRYPWGLQAQVRRFALLPTPRQKFGDGALLQGSSDLPAETGLRTAAGPWWRDEDVDLRLSFFTEHSTNSPVVVATSPTAARTLPIGGVWSQGLELMGSAHWRRWTLTPSYTYQAAVNDSQINWQRGQEIPGRPMWTLNTEISHQFSGEVSRWWRRLSAGAIHNYKSAEALDLGGLWSLPARHQAGLYLGYQEKEWATKLLANNILRDRSVPQNSAFQGTAGPNVLEPEIRDFEIRWQWEILM